ncbi:MAG: BCCT family transporter [Nitrospinota bacterium]
MNSSVKSLVRDWFNNISPPVFFGAAFVTLAIIFFGAIWPESAASLFNNTLSVTTEYLGWYYILAVAFFMVFVLWLYFGPFGHLKIGPQDSEPEFGLLTWFSMLFAAGMGMGLVFWGVAEPITHYNSPPLAEPKTLAAVEEAMKFSFYHWGFHPWAIYIIFGLGIGIFHFRYGLPLAPRSLLYPIFKEKINGPFGHCVDIFCTVGTLLGVATSLGLGAMQINSGLSGLMGIAFEENVQVIIIAIITLVATFSTVTGVHKGIKYLSILNIMLMVALLTFVFIAGPTLFQTKIFMSTLGKYLQEIVQLSLWMDMRTENNWQANWTIFYWGWWMSWCPFVGIFIARISKGRTIKEFVLFVFLIPSFVNFLWFSVFGGTALHLEFLGNGGISETVKSNVAMSLHTLLSHLPWASLTQWVGVILVIIFFITSSDSGSLVDDMVTSGGNPDPPVLNRVFWGFAEGAVAAVLLFVGGLKALQVASISAGLPQSFLVVACCYSLVKAFKHDRQFIKKRTVA